MRTMYRVEARVYTDCEGRYSDYRQQGEYMETVEEAVAYAKQTIIHDTWHSGDYRVIERTIDEQAFTITDNTIMRYDWWAEVGRREYAEGQIERYTQKIAEIEASKARCKTENGIAKKDKEIKKYEKWLAEAKEMIAK